jgi:hypothetical protein
MAIVTSQKWYVRSGELTFICHGCEAEEAAGQLALRAFETDRVDKLGLWFSCSEQGFESKPTHVFWSPSMLLTLCQIPVSWSVINLREE